MKLPLTANKDDIDFEGVVESSKALAQSHASREGELREQKKQLEERIKRRSVLRRAEEAKAAVITQAIKEGEIT